MAVSEIVHITLGKCRQAGPDDPLGRSWLGYDPQRSATDNCVRVERYRDGAFRFVRRTRCIGLDRYSRARWTLTGNPPAGTRFRLRYEAPGDAALAGAKAAWTYLRFTPPR